MTDKLEKIGLQTELIQDTQHARTVTRGKKNESLTLSMYHAAVHDARNDTLIVTVQPQRYALRSSPRRTADVILLHPSVGQRSTAFVCMSVRSLISKTTCQTYQIFCVLLRRQCNT